MKKRNQKWNPKLICANRCLIPMDRYNAQIKSLSRLLYDFFAKKKPSEEIHFQSFELKTVRTKRKAA